MTEEMTQEAFSMDIFEIMNMLPHRYPFLLVDRITECVPGKYCKGYKNLTMNEEGNLVVSDRKASQEVADYIASVSSDADVQALIADVNKKCEEAKASDPALKEFMDSLDSSNAGEGSTAENSEDDASGNNSEMGEMICAAASLNIRQAPDTSSAIMGVLTQGDTVTKIQDAQDGWCQISYNAGSYTIEGYVRSEYLESAN